MPSLVDQRCFNHALREAAARCPSCRNYYCRECITEHEDRVICADCLRKLATLRLQKRQAFAGTLRATQFVLGLLAAWFFFYLLGESLLSMPNAFHEGTLWKSNWLDEE